MMQSHVKVQPDPVSQEEKDRTATSGTINLQDAFIVIDGKRWSALELLKLVADKLATENENGRTHGR